MATSPFRVALVGRTNVGKSTLFNRLTERPTALVSAQAGTTRDRKEGEVHWNQLTFTLVDTGGLDVDPKDEIDAQVITQAQIAIKEADLILFLLDVSTGPLPQDFALAEVFRTSPTPVFVVGNKADNTALRGSVHTPEWRIEGLPTPIPVSATRGNGTGDLLDLIVTKLNTLEAKEAPEEKEEGVPAIRVAIIGKPNVGKSSLINTLVGEKRMIVSSRAHTTREPHDITLEHKGQSYVFIDTAGMRKQARTKEAGGLEAAGVNRTQRILGKADVALFLVDVSTPLGTQDRVLAGLLKERGTSIIVIANKWDLVPDKDTRTMDQFRQYLTRQFPFLRWAPVHFISALKGQKIEPIFSLIADIEKARHNHIPPSGLKRFLGDLMRKNPPKRGKGPVPPKVISLVQKDIRPPRFELTIKSKRTDTISTAWVRYIENQLREAFDFKGTPIKLTVKKYESHHRAG